MTTTDSGPAQQIGLLDGPFTWRVGPIHPSPTPFLSDDFQGLSLDATKWSTITSGIPGASATQANGVLTLANRAYLRTNMEADPLSTGEVRVQGRWKWTSVSPELGTLEILTRTSAQPDPAHFYEAMDGLEFNLWLGPNYPGVAVIHPRGGSIQVGPLTVYGTLHWTNGAWYEFEAIDAGNRARWTIREVGNAANSVTVLCSVLAAHEPVNLVAIHGREHIGGDNICQLDDVRLFVSDCNANQIADATEIAFGSSADCDGDLVPDQCQIQMDFTLDINLNGLLDACECTATAYCTAVQNSTGFRAHIGHAGSTSVGLNDLVLVCTGLPSSTSGIFFAGNAQILIPFGNGYRCVAGSIARTPVTISSSSGVAAQAIDYATFSPGNPITVGATRHFQYWYRNPAAGGAGFNLSDGLSIGFCP